MRDLGATARAASLGLVLLLGLTACGGGSSDGHPGHGVVMSLDVEARSVTLDHEDIPGFMKGMTMTFNVAPDADLEGIDPGAEVDFRVKEDGGVYTLTEIRRTGS